MFIQMRKFQLKEMMIIGHDFKNTKTTTTSTYHYPPPLHHSLDTSLNCVGGNMNL